MVQEFPSEILHSSMRDNKQTPFKFARVLEYMHISCRVLVNFCSTDIWKLCMYTSILPPIPTEGEAIYTGEHATIHKRKPLLPERENVHTKMLQLVIQNRKTYKTKKRKKWPKRQCNTRGNIPACPKNPRKNYPEEEIIKVRDQGKNHTARSERPTRMVG